MVPKIILDWKCSVRWNAAEPNPKSFYKISHCFGASSSDKEHFPFKLKFCHVCCYKQVTFTYVMASWNSMSCHVFACYSASYRFGSFPPTRRFKISTLVLNRGFYILAGDDGRRFSISVNEKRSDMMSMIRRNPWVTRNNKWTDCVPAATKMWPGRGRLSFPKSIWWARGGALKIVNRFKRKISAFINFWNCPIYQGRALGVARSRRISGGVGFLKHQESSRIFLSDFDSVTEIYRMNFYD